MKNPTTIEIESPTKTVDTIEQCYYRVNRDEKRTWLNRLLLLERPESCLIFCNTQIAVDKVQAYLSRKGYACQALHGDIPQGKRLKTMQQFKGGEFHILVATDVAARGIHIEDLSLVINYDVPVEKDSYVHRIGRTGRAGKTGRAITLATSDDIMSLYEIEEHIGALVPEVELPSEAMFEAHRSEAEQWIKDNTIKIPFRAPSEKSASCQNPPGANKKARQGASPARPPRRQENRRNRPDDPNTDPRAAEKPRTAYSSEQTRPSRTVTKPGSTAARPAPAISRPDPAAAKSGSAYSKSGSASAKPGSAYSRPAPTTTRPGPAHSRPGNPIQTAQSKEAPTKQENAGKSFFQRLFQKILGK